MTKMSLMVLAAAILATSSYGQDLRRSAAFGAAVADLNDSTKTALKLSSSSGSHLKTVIPGSSAQKAGFQPGDVIVSVDGKNIENTNKFLSLLKTHYGGDTIGVGFYRKSKLHKTTMVLSPKPMESSNDYEIIYSSVSSGSNRLRTIITKPGKSGNYPAVLLIGGVGCYSIDNPLSAEIQSIKMWSDSLTRNGFVTMRVEKPGTGDSRGIPCNECDFITEKSAFMEGLKQLKSLPYVNRESTFIAGFSMGGIIGPLIAQEEPVKGIIVYGTAGKNWLEYELENSFRQGMLDDVPADSLGRHMRAEYTRLYSLLIEKKTPEQIIKEHPETRPNFFPYPMRNEYFQQVADVNIPGLWMNTKAKVLAMHGSSDFISSAAEHRLIAEIVNRAHPGNATYAEIPQSDHWGLFAENEKASQVNTQPRLNYLPVITSVKWLKENT